MKVRCFNIKWDTDMGDGSEPEPQESLGLPSECVLDTELPEDELEEYLGDELSDKYGFCHYGFNYEVVKEETK